MGNGRRKTVCALLALATTAPWTVIAQGRRWRIGFLTAVSAVETQRRLDILRQGLRGLGHDDAAMHFEVRYAESNFDAMPVMVQELLAAKIDILVVGGTPATLAAKKATSTVPIVMTGVADPIGAGLVKGFSRPGGNVTGTTLFVQGLEIAGKRLQLLREIAPQARRIAIVWDPRNPGDHINFQEALKALRAVNLTAVPIELPDPAQATQVLDKALTAKPDALLVTEGGNNQIARKEIVAFAARHRLPAMYGERQFIQAGGLICYGTSYDDQIRGVASYVDRIMRGAKPADLPVEQPTRFEMVINLKTARALGFSIPHSMEVRADELIR